MDALNLAYCTALLSFAAPKLERWLLRLLAGAAVGLTAASLLPFLKSLNDGPY